MMFKELSKEKKLPLAMFLRRKETAFRGRGGMEVLNYSHISALRGRAWNLTLAKSEGCVYHCQHSLMPSLHVVICSSKTPYFN
jgi:hypothetical protein